MNKNTEHNNVSNNKNNQKKHVSSNKEIESKKNFFEQVYLKPSGNRGLGVFFRYFLLFGLFSSLTILILTTAFYTFMYLSVPSSKDLKNYQYKIATEIYDRYGNKFAEIGDERRYPVGLEEMGCVINATIAVEDRRFFEHSGVDLRGIIRALFIDLTERTASEGASTLTQQVARNLYLTNEKTIIRKIKEIMIAQRIENVLTKDETLELYLNLIPYGRGNYGVKAAALGYFNKSAKDLTIAECAVIAAVPKGPAIYSPHINYTNSMSRKRKILGDMYELEYIDDTQYKEALEQRIIIVDYVLPKRLYGNYFIDYVIQEVLNYSSFKRVDNASLYNGGYKIYTTLVSEYQLAAEASVKDGLDAVSQFQGYNPSHKQLSLSFGKSTLSGENLSAHQLMNFNYKLNRLLYSLDKVNNSNINLINISQSDYLVNVTEATSYMELYRELNDDIVSAPTYLRDTVNAIVVNITKSSMTLLPILDDFVVDIIYSDFPERNEILGQFLENITLSSANNWAVKSNVKSYRGEILRDFRNSFKQNEIVYISKQDGAWNIVDDPSSEGSLISILPNGEIVAMVGGYDYVKSQYNRAYEAKRQFGSSFKPFLYATAIEQGYVPTSVIDDRPILESGVDEEGNSYIWRPHNYEDKFYGLVNLYSGLSKSLNTVAILLAREVGVRNIINQARKFGFTEDLPQDLTISLGSSSSSMLETAIAYTSFVNLGLRYSPKSIITIVDRFDNTIFNSSDIKEVPTDVMKQETAQIMLDMLEDVVDNGTGRRVKYLSRVAGGKTGTTNEYRDALFVAIYPNLITLSWVGNDNFTAIGPSASGAVAALPIVSSYLNNINDIVPYAVFPIAINNSRYSVGYYKVSNINNNITAEVNDNFIMAPFPIISSNISEAGYEPIKLH